MRVFVIVVAVLTATAGGALGQQSPTPAPPSGPKQGAAPQTSAGGQVPHPTQLMVLIRSTLLAANHANLTGNYSVLRDLGTPNFQETNSAARLAEIFQKLRSMKIDLGPIAVLDAKLVRQPSIDANGRLRLTGYFPSRPERVNFDLSLEMIEGRWRLHGIALNTTPSEQPVATTGATGQPPPAATPKLKQQSPAITSSGGTAASVPAPRKTTSTPKKPSPIASDAAAPDPQAKVKPKTGENFNPLSPF